MQFDLFSAPLQRAALSLRAHLEPGYAARTRDNAQGADLTVALAEDFTTAGEKLTHRMAGDRYVGVGLRAHCELAAEQIVRAMLAHNAFSLNIAGNGIYTLSKFGWTQTGVNQKVFEVLRRVSAQRPLSFVRSGGQTGVDTAGLVAGLALGIPVIGLYPQGFRRRFANGQDRLSTPEELELELRQFCEQLDKTALCL